MTMTQRELNGHNLPEGERLDVNAGGFLVGPGTEISDDIPAVGCSVFVLNAETVRILGRDRIDKLVDLALGFRTKLMLSNGEYVVPALASVVLFDFWQKINLSGVISRANGWGEAEHEELRQVVDSDIASLEQRVMEGC